MSDNSLGFVNLLSFEMVIMLFFSKDFSVSESDKR